MPSLIPLYQLAELVNGWHAGLSPAARDQLHAKARRVTFTTGQRIYSRGEPSDGIYGVLEGCVRLSGVAGKSHETILDFLGAGVWFGEVSALDGLPRGHDVIAYAPTTVLHLAQPDLNAALRLHTELGRALLRLVALRSRLLFTAVESYSIQPLEPRLANRLLMLATSHGRRTPRGTRIELHLPQDVIAQLIGATRQRVNQICKKWNGEGLMEQDAGRLVLLKRAELERLAQL